MIFHILDYYLKCVCVCIRSESSSISCKDRWVFVKYFVRGSGVGVPIVNKTGGIHF